MPQRKEAKVIVCEVAGCDRVRATTAARTVYCIWCAARIKQEILNAHREKYADRIVDRKRQWRSENPEKQAAAYKADRFNRLKNVARSRNSEVTISKDEYEQIVSQPCFYCGGVLPPTGYGVDRIENELGYIPGNCRPCCTVCNLAKRDMLETEFREWAVRLFGHWISPTQAAA